MNAAEEYIAILKASAQQAVAEMIDSPDDIENYAQSNTPFGRMLAKEIRLTRERRQQQTGGGYGNDE